MADSIGKSIRSRRLLLKMTQDDLAAASGLSKNYVSQVETGRKLPSLRALARVASALGTDPSDLLRTDPIHNELSRIVKEFGHAEVTNALRQLDKVRNGG